MIAEKKEIEDQKLLRCFIALELSRETIEEIEEIQKLIKKKNLFYGKFTEPENLHLTLKFLGELDEDKIEEVKKKLRGIKFNDFEVSLGEAGTFINRYNSLLWVKLNGKGIWDLQELLDEKLKDIFSKEERFMSHITIARMKKIPSKNLLLEYVKSMKIKKIKFQVRDFILKKSELKSDGPVYTNIETYELKN